MKNDINILICLFLSLIVQFIINNFTIVYIDIFGAILVLMLLIGTYSWLSLIIISILADLFGHWYLGTHLIGLVIISMLSGNITNFYKMCNPLHKSVIAALYYSVLSIVIILIELVSNKIFFSPISIVIQLFVVIPFVQLVIYSFINTKKSNFLIYE